MPTWTLFTLWPGTAYIYPEIPQMPSGHFADHRFCLDLSIVLCLHLRVCGSLSGWHLCLASHSRCQSIWTCHFLPCHNPMCAYLPASTDGPGCLVTSQGLRYKGRKWWEVSWRGAAEGVNLPLSACGTQASLGDGKGWEAPNPLSFGWWCCVSYGSSLSPCCILSWVQCEPPPAF